MPAVLISLLVIFGILVVSEYLWRKKILRNERARKFVHVLVGTFVAFWPWFLTWRQIQLISLAFLIVVVIVKRYKIFHAIVGVKRKTYGEEFFALGIGLSAMATDNKVFFMIAVLHIALADGLAALIGQKYGKNWRYTVFGQPKTVLGSMAFWLISLWILGLGLLLSPTSMPYQNYLLAIAIIPPIATIVENVVTMGLDNVAVPITVLALLNLLA